MKRVTFLLIALVCVSLRAQTPPNPLAVPGTPAAPGLPASPSNPTLPSTPATPGFSSQMSAAGSTNAFGGFGLTNFGTVNATDLGFALRTVQNDVQQALSLLSAFNANVGFAGAGVVPTTAAAPSTGTAGGAANLAQNLAGNTAANVSVNVANPGAGAPAATPPTAFASPINAAVPATALSPIFGGVTNIAGLPVGSFGPNGSGSEASGSTLRLLIVLESDLERILPELGAINGSGVSLPGTVGAGFGSNFMGFATNRIMSPLTNVSTVMTPSPSTVVPKRLTPTGR